MTKEEHIDYWIKTAEHDIKAMQNIFNAGSYDWALFIGHLALEKISKALWVKNNINNIPPKIHDLVKLSDEAQLVLSDPEKEFLLEVNDFNLETRYPDYKMDFHKKCTREFAEEYFNKIMNYYNVLSKKLK